MARARNAAILFFFSILLVAPLDAVGTTGPPNRAAIAKCFRARNVLVDPQGSWYLPKRVEPRERQMGLSFVLLPTGSGVMATVLLEPSVLAARRARARAIAYAVEVGDPRNAKLYARAVELHGTSIVVWLAEAALPGNFEPGRIATKCLGPRTT
jgi:hypothetical protein